MNLQQALNDGIYGFVVSAVFLGCWVAVVALLGVAVQLMSGTKDKGGRDE